MTPLLTLNDIEITGAKLIIREDFNVPMKDGQILDDSRIRAAIPTIQMAIERGADKITLLSHLGRPKTGVIDQAHSLEPLAIRLSELLKLPVAFQREGFAPSSNTKVTLCENVRFLAGEKENDMALGQTMAAMHDIFVMDAFATAHRKHASTFAIALSAPLSVAGPLLAQEIQAMERVLHATERPIGAIIGGAKISTKLSLLKSLCHRVDCLITGGGITNMLLAAKGLCIGASIQEPALMSEAKALLSYAEKNHTHLPLPQDVVVVSDLGQPEQAQIKSVGDLNNHDIIVDIGPQTIHTYQNTLTDCRLVVWNGPVGIFETPAFANGTKAMAQTLGAHPGFTLAGGGDTINALHTFDVAEDLSYISTGGGAFLSYLQEGTLPVLPLLSNGLTQGRNENHSTH